MSLFPKPDPPGRAQTMLVVLCTALVLGVWSALLIWLVKLAAEA